jgi:hypothetical protein
MGKEHLIGESPENENVVQGISYSNVLAAPQAEARPVPQLILMNGWIKLYRKLIDSNLWLAEPFTRGQAWVDMIALANHDDGYIRVRGIRIDIRRGQLAWSELSLAARWKWSRNKVRKWLEELEKKEQQIEQQKNRVTTLISIVNYESYQGQGTTDETTEGTTERQQKVQQKVHKQEVKKEKKKRNNTLLSRFDEFWKAYPKKKAIADAEKAWMKINQENGLVDAILRAIAAQTKSEDWTRDRGKWIPLPASWLNGRRWEDDTETKKPTESLWASEVDLDHN